MGIKIPLQFDARYVCGLKYSCWNVLRDDTNLGSRPSPYVREGKAWNRGYVGCVAGVLCYYSK